MNRAASKQMKIEISPTDILRDVLQVSCVAKDNFQEYACSHRLSLNFFALSLSYSPLLPYYSFVAARLKY